MLLSYILTPSCRLQVLINVGPAKPTRRLPESERKALLSESMEAANQSLEDMQGSEHEDTPQIVPYMETSFNDNDNNVPVPVKPVRVKFPMLYLCISCVVVILRTVLVNSLSIIYD